MFNIKKSLLCISAISCMSLYASTIEVTNPITIGSTPSVPTETGYNYWENSNTYVFNTSSNNNYTYWKPKGTVTVDEGYTLKLLTDYNSYYYVLDCNNIFTNNGNVIIDNYGALSIDYNNTTISDSINNGTIYIITGKLGLYWSATLNNKGTITFKDSSYIVISDSSTLTNTGTIDISNITDLSEWGNNYGTFKLEGGSTFILPKSIPTNKINTSWRINPIILNGTDNNPVNIVIPKDCEYIKNIDNNKKEDLFEAIEDATGFTFSEDKDNVKFSWQTSIDNEYEYVDECD